MILLLTSRQTRRVRKLIVVVAHIRRRSPIRISVIPSFFLLIDTLEPSFQKPSKTFMLRSGKVESVKVHDFVPHRYKVVKEFLLGILTSVDFRQGPELGVRTED
jgi:hypothetical protein